MNKVISALERQLRIEEAKKVHNKIEKDTSRTFLNYKGSPLYNEDDDFIMQLRQAIIVLNNYENENGGKNEA